MLLAVTAGSLLATRVALKRVRGGRSDCESTRGTSAASIEDDPHEGTTTPDRVTTEDRVAPMEAPKAAAGYLADSRGPSIDDGSSTVPHWQVEVVTKVHAEQSPAVEYKPTRRALREIGIRKGGFTMREVARHTAKDDGWIVYRDQVYDITEHIMNHPSWKPGGGDFSTVLSILAHLGMDCTAEFDEIHRQYPQSWGQLKPFYIGELKHPHITAAASMPSLPRSAAEQPLRPWADRIGR